MTTTTNTARRIAELKESIALSTADLRLCQTRAQVQSVNAVIAARKAELLALEEKEQEQAMKKDADSEQVGTIFDNVQPSLFVHADTASPQAVKQTFTLRAVTALATAPTGAHNVYIHWFRIDCGCWMDAEEIVNAGSLADYLEALGMEQADVRELMTQDWDCQDAEGLAARCIGNYGGFDWKLMSELLEVSVPAAVLVAGLEAGLEPDAIEDAYMGEWDSAEDMAYDMWDETGMLESVPEAARGYIDWAMVARDMVLGGDVVEANGHYFHAA